MARIFLSHSSANDVEAVALGDWLTSEGWDDFFLDLDPERGIAAGERWERRLHEAANRCEAVLFLVSRAWLDSPWCLKEFTLAEKLNKRTFCVLVEDLAVSDLPPELTATWQLVNLATGADHRLMRVTLPDGREAHVTFSQAGLARLKSGLTRAGLDARFFAWPPEGEPDRPPYRGLRALEAEDAGIFYGREAPTIEALDRLRGLAEAAPPRLMAILAASGAGKSSFLRAGLVPRLRRDDRDFLMLPIVRPERSALTGETGLLRSLEEASRSAGLRHSRADIRAAMADAAALGAIIDDLTGAARQADADGDPGKGLRAVIAIDQAEELFLAEGAEEAGAFLKLIGELAAARDSNLIVIFTIRSDSFERLQTAPEVQGLQPFSLPPMPRGAYQTVIEGPARRLADTDRALAIEPALTQALLADIEDGGGKDALPLLAFTLERLYLEYGGSGTLTLAAYRELGGIGGSIEAAVEGALKAADNDPAVPRDRAARLALLRRALIPWLAGIDTETGQPRRRVARLSEIPQEARPLVEHLIAARLLATDIAPETGERTIEPAHEALLRQWGLLQGWLEEDFATLATLEGIRRAARDWAANDKDAAWLAHSAGRLEDAEAVARRADFAGLIEATDRAYLDAARALDTERRNRELEEAKKLAEAERQAAERQRLVAQRTRIGLIVASILAVVAIGLGFYGFQQANLATAKGEEAQTGAARLSVSVASGLIDQGASNEAGLLLLNAAKSFDDKTVPDEMLIAFHKLNESMAAKAAYALPKGAVAMEGLDALYFIDPAGGRILRFDGSGPAATVYDGDPKLSPIARLGVSQDGQTLFVLRKDRTVEKVAEGGKAVTVGKLPGAEKRDDLTYDAEELEIHPDGMIVATQGYYASATGGGDVGTFLALMDAATGKTYTGTSAAFRFAYLPSPGGKRYLFARSSIDEPAQVFRIVSGDPGLTLEPQELPADEINRLRVRACLSAGRSAIPDELPTVSFSETSYDQRCFMYGKSLVHSYFEGGSAGAYRTDEIIGPDGKVQLDDNGDPVDIGGYVRLDGAYDLQHNFTWLGGSTAAGLFAATVDRDLLVFNENGVVFQQKHPTEPGPGHFFPGDKLAVVETASNRVIVYNLAYSPPRSAISHEGEEALVNGKAQLTPFNKGTCVGFGFAVGDNAIDYSATLPDGATIALGGAKLVSAEGPPQIVITDKGQRQTIDTSSAVGSKDACVQFSRDWTRMLLYQLDSRAVSLYDFDRIRASGTLDGAKLDDLPGKFSSAFPVGPDHDIVTTDYTHAVLRWHKDAASGTWSNQEIYNGDNPVFYAEPDDTGNRLLLMESLSGGDVKGFLYSVPARQRWIDLGSDYKWFGEAFSEDLGIAAGAREVQDYIRLPKLHELVSETEGRLPDSCKPREEGVYDTSPCWPGWLRGQ